MSLLGHLEAGISGRLIVTGAHGWPLRPDPPFPGERWQAPCDGPCSVDVVTGAVYQGGAMVGRINPNQPSVEP
jgi:hypothetical protein